MIQIKGINVLDGDTPTTQGIDLMRRVHEGMDMGCWHKIKIPVMPNSPCEYCGTNYWHKWNPSYLNSLDASKPIREKLAANEFTRHHYMGALIEHPDTKPMIIAEPYVHLEIAATVLRVDDRNYGKTTKRTILSIWEEEWRDK